MMDNDTQKIYMVSESRLKLMESIISMAEEYFFYGDNDWSTIRSNIQNDIRKYKELTNAGEKVGDIHPAGDTRSVTDSQSYPQLDDD